MKQQSHAPFGIAGWLILPAFVTFASVAYLSVAVLDVITYSLSDVPLDDIDFVMVALFLSIPGAWAFACFLLIKRKRWYPASFVVLSGLLLLLNIAVMFVNFRAGRNPLPGALLAWETPYLFNALLIPYMLLSKRVKNTFVN